MSKMTHDLTQRVMGWHHGERSGRTSTGTLIDDLLASLRLEQEKHALDRIDIDQWLGWKTFWHNQRVATVLVLHLEGQLPT